MPTRSINLLLLSICPHRQLSIAATLMNKNSLPSFLTEKIEELGVKPLQELQKQLGGWPMIDPDWNEKEFDLLHLLSELRLLSNNYLVKINVAVDLKDNTKRITVVGSQLSEYSCQHRTKHLGVEFQN